MNPYKSYLHVERLDSEACEGLLENDVVNVTAKIDGTNACVWYDPETSVVRAGSRKRELNANKDNASFFSWIQSGLDEPARLRWVCEDHPNLIIYGEWLGLEKFIGSIKSYDSEAMGHMYIFDVYDRDALKYLSDQQWRPILAAYGLEPYFVELLATLSHPSYEDIVKIAEDNHFLLSNANHAGEGVVCKAVGWKDKHYRTCYGKIVLDEYKQRKREGKRKPQIAREGVEQDIVAYFVTDAELSKSKAKVCVMCNVDEFDVKNGKHIGMFLNLIFDDLLDEMKLIVKKYKSPIIDFKVLRAECQNKGREFLGLM